MSQSAAVATRPAARSAPRPSGRPAVRTAVPRLRVVGSPAPARSRAGLVVASLALLGVGLVGLLLVNVSLEKGAFVRRTQQAQIQQLADQRQALTEQLAALEAPQALAARALALGMVQAPNVTFLDPDGKVLGVQSPAVAEKPAIVTPGGSSVGGQGTAKGSSTGASAPSQSPAVAAVGKATASTKVTAGGPAAATTTATPSGRPATSAAAAKAPAPTTARTTKPAKAATTPRSTTPSGN